MALTLNSKGRGKGHKFRGTSHGKIWCKKCRSSFCGAKMGKKVLVSVH